MAYLSDTELEEYCPPEPVEAVVFSDRYIITVDQMQDRIARLDTVTQTGKAFDGCGVTRTSGTASYNRSLFGAFGYAWTVGILSGTTSSLIRIGADGSVTTKSLGYIGNPISSATFAADSGNLWIGITQSATTRILMVDPATFGVTLISTGGNPTIAAYNGIVYQQGTNRWNASTGAALAAGPSINFRVGVTDSDGIRWGTQVTNLVRADLAAGTTSTIALGIGSATDTHGICLGPNNLVYVTQSVSPYEALAVVDRNNLTVGTWEFTHQRTNRTSIAYANGKMWALGGETP